MHSLNSTTIFNRTCAKVGRIVFKPAEFRPRKNRTGVEFQPNRTKFGQNRWSKFGQNRWWEFNCSHSAIFERISSNLAENKITVHQSQSSIEWFKVTGVPLWFRLNNSKALTGVISKILGDPKYPWLKV
jgi:hypothetical protein